MPVFDDIYDIVDLIVGRAGPVIVDGDVDAIFLNQFVEEIERGLVLIRIGTQGLQANRLGIVKRLPGLGLVPVEPQHAVGQ